MFFPCSQGKREASRWGWITSSTSRGLLLLLNHTGSARGAQRPSARRPTCLQASTSVPSSWLAGQPRLLSFWRGHPSVSFIGQYPAFLFPNHSSAKHQIHLSVPVHNMLSRNLCSWMCLWTHSFKRRCPGLKRTGQTLFQDRTGKKPAAFTQVPPMQGGPACVQAGATLHALASVRSVARLLVLHPT